ncbi:site-specific integrase [Desulfovibrio sulfodismutans]|uniref:Site-specific integrase n=1 Tax=Desulfolutivibrio sulfodismutans TaxID=63561 RepID=A0A7K3NJE6_9BACT|nr:site-specific integrase [Desulfolutivibrio sulfodismutans]NDY56227.1 site-specific integrase [Desulfolutivibrio sulfodismutans]QLA11287.1 tyrosine-type recombinase/integrase [Desulfolutivibrio sulfodismutans DSM 3696]
MAAKHSSPYPGVRYREHPTRLHRGAPDCYFTLRYRRDGRAIEEALGWASDGWSAKKAAAILAELNRAHATGQPGHTLVTLRAEAERRRDAEAQAATQAARDAQSLRHLAETHYLPWATRNKRSASDDAQRLRLHVLPRLGDLTPAEITVGHIESLRDELLSRRSPATTLQCLAVLRATLNHLSRLGLFEGRNPVCGIRLPRLQNARLRFFTRDEFTRFIDAAADLPLFQDAAILAVNTGLRLGELMRLARPDVDLVHGLLHVRDTGGKPGGIVPVNAAAAAVLARRLDVGLPRLFAPRGDRHWYSDMFRRVADRCGINDGITDRRHLLTFHSLRHTFASWLALDGTDLYRIQRLMRHESLAMTQRYAHLIPSALQSDVARLCAPPCPPDSCGA